MIQKKYKTDKNIYCLTLLALFIVSGCATQTKQSKVIAIQKNRINKLEKELAKRDQWIEQHKVQKVLEQAPATPEKVAVLRLKRMIQKKQWVKALQYSAEVKNIHPHSVAIAKYRVAIFKKMGLQKQASDEINGLRKSLAQQKMKRKNSSRR